MEGGHQERRLPGFIPFELHFSLQLLLAKTSLLSLALLLQEEGCPLLGKLILCLLLILQSRCHFVVSNSQGTPLSYPAQASSDPAQMSMST
jgi:hypothetical protein